MESRIKGRVLSIIVAVAMIASTSTVFAATTKTKWPPSGFINPSHGEIYYKLPKPKELEGLLSAAHALAQQIKRCTSVACGVVTVGSSTGCTWWNITSTVYGALSATDPSIVPYGNLQTTAIGTKPKQIATVLLISNEPLKKYVNVGSLGISCHHDPITTSPQKVPSNIYIVNTPTPTASPSDAAALNTN